MSITEQLRSRYRPAYDRHATTKATKVHLWTATAAIDQIAAKRAEVDKDKNLSEAGKASKVSDFAQSLAPTLARARGAVVGAKRAVARQREALVPKVKDRNNVSAAMLRGEMRSVLRNMRPAEAIAFATSDVADETFFTAIFETPIALSNLTGIGKDRLLQAYLDRFASTQLADLARSRHSESRSIRGPSSARKRPSTTWRALRSPPPLPPRKWKRLPRTPVRARSNSRKVPAWPATRW